MIKLKDFLRDNQEEKRENRIVTKWTKIEIVIPTGMKYRYPQPFPVSIRN